MKFILRNSIRFFLWSTIYYFASALVAGIIESYVDSSQLTDAIYYTVLCSVHFSIFCVVFFYIWLGYYYSLFLAFCNPQKASKGFDYFYSGIKIHGWYDKVIFTEFFLNRAYCLLAMERYDEVIENYFKLEQEIKKPISIYMFNIYIDIATAAACKGDIANAQRYLDMSIDLYKKLAKNPFVKSKVNRYYKMTSALILTKKGFLSEAEVLLLEVENKYAPSMKIEKVDFAFRLGLVQLHLGKYNESVPRIENVVKNGNTMACKVRAEEMLKELRRKNEIS